MDLAGLRGVRGRPGMPGLHAFTADLVVEAGRPAGTSPFLSIDSVTGLGEKGSRHFFAILEPVESVPGAAEAAAEVFQRLRAVWERRGSSTPTAAILTAVQDVNRWLFEANRQSPGNPVRFGLTCAVARNDDLYIVQAAPTQILIGQEGELYTFPELEHWRWNHQAQPDENCDQPLGLDAEIEPDIYHTQIAGGDLIVFCSTSLARIIEREPRDVFLGSDSDAAIAHLGQIAFDYSVSDAWAAAVTVPETELDGPKQGVLFIRRVGEFWSNLLPEETANRFLRRAREVDSEVDPDDLAGHTHEHAGYEEWGTASVDVEAPYDRAGESWEPFTTGAERSSFHHSPASHEQREADADYWRPSAGEFLDDDLPADAGEGRGGKLTKLLAGAILALSAAVVGVWQIAVHRDRAIGEPPDDGTLGLPRLQRFDDTMQFPDFTGVRRRLPRAPVSRRAIIVAAALIFLITAAVVFTIYNRQVQQREAQRTQLLQASAHAREQAEQASDPATAYAFLLAAQARIREAEPLGLEKPQADQERAVISRAMDQALHVERLTSIQAVGGIPAAPQGVTPHVFFGNGQLFIFSDALYRLDPNGTKLVRLLGSGDQVDGQPVGTLLGGSWGDGTPVAFDSQNLYLFDPTGAGWSRHRLGTAGSPYGDITGSSGYGGNLYLLSPGSGEILKFKSSDFNAQPEAWTSGLAVEDLRSGIDMIVDGRIYVLLRDGRILDFFMSALEKTVTPQAVPAIENAVALSSQTDRPYYYVADDQGRILRLDREGKLVQQFMTDESESGVPSLNGIQSMAVDDVLGTAYVLTDHGLLMVRLPGPTR